MQYIVIDNTDDPIVAQKDGKAAIFDTLEDAKEFSSEFQNGIVVILEDVGKVSELFDKLQEEADKLKELNEEMAKSIRIIGGV